MHLLIFESPQCTLFRCGSEVRNRGQCQHRNYQPKPWRTRNDEHQEEKCGGQRSHADRKEHNQLSRFLPVFVAQVVDLGSVSPMCPGNSAEYCTAAIRQRRSQTRESGQLHLFI